MDILSLLSGPFVFLDAVLPIILLAVAALILTGNFAIKSFFDRCGLGLKGRYVCGALIGILGLALITNLSFLATAAMIVLLVVLATMAMRDGARQVAVANIVMAAILIPVAMIQ